MTNDQYKKHQILKQYRALKDARENAIVDYCSALAKLTKVTQNISPLPGGHGNESDYDEKVFELAGLFIRVREINGHIITISRAVNSLPTLEAFVVRELYFRNRKAAEIARILEKSKRTIFRIRNEALDHLEFYRIVGI